MLESFSFYDGYCLAIGLSAGISKETLCAKFSDCQVLEGKKYRHPPFARPSMKTWRFNAFKIAAKVHGDAYPISSGSIHYKTLMGRVLIT
jgi:hypothetical protein